MENPAAKSYITKTAFSLLFLMIFNFIILIMEIVWNAILLSKDESVIPVVALGLFSLIFSSYCLRRSYGAIDNSHGGYEISIKMLDRGWFLFYVQTLLELVVRCGIVILTSIYYGGFTYNVEYCVSCFVIHGLIWIIQNYYGFVQFTFTADIRSVLGNA